MKQILICSFLLLFTTLIQANDNVHSFTVKDIDGKEIKLDQYKGKTLLIINVASKCGLTKQYNALQALHDKYKDQGLVLLAFPANNFKGQEPGSNQEIKQFCSAKFNITFQMMSKIDVIGDKQVPLYKYLTQHSDPTGDISWNFEKFLIDADGNIAQRFAPRIKPNDKKVIKAIEAELAKK